MASESQDTHSASSPVDASPRRKLRNSLFVRIYATFVVAVLGFAALVGLLVWAAASSWNEQRVLELVERTHASGPPLAQALLSHDEARLNATVAALEQQLDAHLTVLPRLRGRRLGEAIGEAPKHGRPAQLHIHEHPLTKAENKRLRHGHPLVRRRGLGPPSIGLALFEHGFDVDVDDNGDLDELEDDKALTKRELNRQRGRLIAIVTIDPKHSPLRGLLGVGALLLLALAGGAWPLARSLTSRLAKLERSTRALAKGELSHRAEIANEPHDEVDLLAVSFNEMADRLENLMTGQRTLLANVSHELRTPIARTKVLVEILGERIEQIREDEQRGEAIAPEHLARLERGFEEMQEDIDEVEALIKDLLTSGRLELGRDGSFAGALVLERIELAQLCADVAGRFDAVVECDDGIELQGDRMLLERLLKNLLANARRACPDGAVVIRGNKSLGVGQGGRGSSLGVGQGGRGSSLGVGQGGRGSSLGVGQGGRGSSLGVGQGGRGSSSDDKNKSLSVGQGDTVVLEVEDDGPGIPPDKRSQIFEPFARLDSARARDQGGVGLGLYLCRQIASAHAGNIRVESRRDGHSGARFVIVLRDQ